MTDSSHKKKQPIDVSHAQDIYNKFTKLQNITGACTSSETKQFSTYVLQ